MALRNNNAGRPVGGNIRTPGSKGNIRTQNGPFRQEATRLASAWDQASKGAAKRSMTEERGASMAAKPASGGKPTVSMSAAKATPSSPAAPVSGQQQRRATSNKNMTVTGGNTITRRKG